MSFVAAMEFGLLDFFPAFSFRIDFASLRGMRARHVQHLSRSS